MTDFFREFLLLVGVPHCLTPAHLKEEDATVERYNRNLRAHLLSREIDFNFAVRKLSPEICIDESW